MLEMEEKELTEKQTKQTADNENLTNENLDLDKKIKDLEKRIRISNLLTDVDIEELQQLAKKMEQMEASRAHKQQQARYMDFDAKHKKEK